MMEWWNNGILGIKFGKYLDLNPCFANCIVIRPHPSEPIVPTFLSSIIPRYLSTAQPVYSDLAQLPARRAYSPEGGPGFLSINKN
jgi:hypothetical protein